MVETTTDGEGFSLGDLMRQAQDGDQTAYKSLLRTVSDLARNYAALRLPSGEGADDVAQECLLALHRSRHTYEPTRPFHPWLFAIIRHRLLDYARRNTRIRLREVADSNAYDNASNETECELVAWQIEELHTVLTSLPEQQRQIIEMLKIEELSVATIARRLGMSESNVKVTAHRGYLELRRRLQRNPSK